MNTTTAPTEVKSATFPKVLVVEDDPQIGKSLSMSLSLSGYEVSLAGTLEQAWLKVASHWYDILLLDVGLPDGSGIDLCAKLRAAGHTVPILFLSARTDEETVVKGMTSGADDYIRKPFGTEELKVRIQNLLKRAGPPKQRLVAGPLVLDTEKRTAMLSGQTLTLGRREFDILTILVKKAGDVVTRENILSQIDEKPDLYDRTIDSHMSHLRRKMRETAGENLQILSVYGVGYRLHWKDAPIS